MNQEELIKMTAEATANQVMFLLKTSDMIKKNSQTPFQKTEILLYNYNHFLAAINNKLQQIATIQEEGIPKKSKSVSSYSSSVGMRDIKSDYEKAEEKIEAIEGSISVTKAFIEIINGALDNIKEDKYFDIIPMKYMEGVSTEEIANFFNVDTSTINRNKNRLINILQIRLFSDEVITQLLIS